MDKRVKSHDHHDGDGRADGPTQLGQRAVAPDDGAGRGLAALRDASKAFTVIADELREERAANADLELRASLLHDANIALQHQVAELTERERAARMELQVLDARAAGQLARADRLLTALREMHQALYTGSTARFILQAAMQITSAERGYYVVQDANDRLVVRAAIEVPATVGDAASPFIASLAAPVLETGKAVCWTDSVPPAGEEPQQNERFGTGAAVPVSVRGEPHGVIIVLDKDGHFVDDDIDSLLSIGRHAGVAVENARLSQEVQQAYVATIAVLADTVIAKDPYIHGHCQQVSRYARRAAERLELPESEKRVACYAALLHDVGKIGVSDGVLNKPGPLLAEERQLVEAHVRIGYDILNNIPALRDVASAVLYHHEWFDGSGYPDGLEGSEIPIASRIVGTVDAYCAMLDRRSYKEAMAPDRARAELIRCAGTQFDPRVVEAVLEAIDETDRATAQGEQQDGGLSGVCGLLPHVQAADGFHHHA